MSVGGAGHRRRETDFRRASLEWLRHPGKKLAMGQGHSGINPSRFRWRMRGVGDKGTFEIAARVPSNSSLVTRRLMVLAGG